MTGLKFNNCLNVLIKMKKPEDEVITSQTASSMTSQPVITSQQLTKISDFKEQETPCKSDVKLTVKDKKSARSRKNRKAQTGSPTSGNEDSTSDTYNSGLLLKLLINKKN